MTDQFLTIHDLVAGYSPEVDILQGVSCQVERGQLVVIIGANGAGKSTLARTIFGLVPVRAGEIMFKGKNITGFPPEKIVRQGISYVPQVANVFPSLTVAENLEMGGFLDDSKKLRSQIEKVLTIFPALTKKLAQRAGTLSGGERQMLAMGKALMIEPELLILDEPSAALSPILVQEVFQLIKNINQNGITIILVEQNARKALGIADLGYVMDSGKIEFQGTGQDLLTDPRVAELYLGVGKLK
ncbi:MAG: ABC transporter ATP-binding protein [Pseudanabaenaceae cyanobacterium]